VRTALALAVLAAFVAVPTAAGDGGPSPGVDQGGPGVVSPSGAVRYVAVPMESSTIVEVIRVSGGTLRTWWSVKGHFGIPYVTNLGAVGGLSRDGRLLVLSDAVGAGLRTVSHFVLLRTDRLRPTREIALRGDFAYDALSPDASTLYMIQHTSARDYSRYRVRAYDLRARHLLSGAIVDRTEPKNAMRGFPLARVTSADGAWVYTLYSGGKMPFVHALDTVHRHAFCLDLPWKGSQNVLWQMHMSLSRDGSRIIIRGKGHTIAVHTPGAA